MQYYVYILTNKYNKVLYTGVTNSLERRFYEHKLKTNNGFSKKYNTDKLVYFEIFSDPIFAISREKQIKNMKRCVKIGLIEKINSNWDDLSIKLEM